MFCCLAPSSVPPTWPARAPPHSHSATAVALLPSPRICAYVASRLGHRGLRPRRSMNQFYDACISISAGQSRQSRPTSACAPARSATSAGSTAYRYAHGMEKRRSGEAEKRRQDDDIYWKRASSPLLLVSLSSCHLSSRLRILPVAVFGSVS